MSRKAVGLLLGACLTLSACGLPADDAGGTPNPDLPILQIRSEGGFAPLEWSLRRGPTYTVLQDGRIIYEGPMIEIFPQPLLPNYQVAMMTEHEMADIRELIDRIGLAHIANEHDDTSASFVADATTEVVTYWDENGEHVYSVYALGIGDDPFNDTAQPTPKRQAFIDLIDFLAAATGSNPAHPYQPERVRILAGAAMGVPEPGFEDIRLWPLDSDPREWIQMEIGWSCTTLGPEVMELFADATQITEWMHPDEMMDAPTFRLLVRPLLPGEADCPVS